MPNSVAIPVNTIVVIPAFLMIRSKYVPIKMLAVCLVIYISPSPSFLSTARDISFFLGIRSCILANSLLYA